MPHPPLRTELAGPHSTSHVKRPIPQHPPTIETGGRGPQLSRSGLVHEAGSTTPRLLTAAGVIPPRWSTDAYGGCAWTTPVDLFWQSWQARSGTFSLRDFGMGMSKAPLGGFVGYATPSGGFMISSSSTRQSGPSWTSVAEERSGTPEGMYRALFETSSGGYDSNASPRFGSSGPGGSSSSGA